MAKVIKDEKGNRYIFNTSKYRKVFNEYYEMKKREDASYTRTKLKQEVAYHCFVGESTVKSWLNLLR